MMDQDVIDRGKDLLEEIQDVIMRDGDAVMAVSVLSFLLVDLFAYQIRDKNRAVPVFDDLVQDMRSMLEAHLRDERWQGPARRSGRVN